ncbi:MAG: alpha/beta hydrolase [Lachnospiraceae bacterium]
MLHERFTLSEDGTVYMDTYIHTQSGEKPSQMEPWRPIKRPHDYWQVQKRPAIIVLPGGAYKELSDREGEPVALTFLKEGFNTFVLYYSIGEASAYPQPLEDISKAIWLVRQHAQEWAIDEHAITVMGFSAGAHLATLAATQWNTRGLHERLGIPAQGNKPDAAVVGYGPVMRENTDENLDSLQVGAMIANPVPEFETYRYVDDETCPMFLWHTWHDPLVPSLNALKMAGALCRRQINYELHIFNRGTHGMSVCNDLSDYEAPLDVCPPNAATWVAMCAQWIKELFYV